MDKEHSGSGKGTHPFLTFDLWPSAGLPFAIHGLRYRESAKGPTAVLICGLARSNAMMLDSGAPQ